jgi:hypothetical protein
MKVGDVVTTTKHSHKMTVGAIDGNRISCQYFIGNELNEGAYELAELTICQHAQ